MQQTNTLKQSLEIFFKLIDCGKLSDNVFLDLKKLSNKKKEEIFHHNWIRYFFENYDKDHSGYVDVNELQALTEDVCHTLGTEISKEEVQRVLKKMNITDDLSSVKLDIEQFDELCDELGIFEKGVHDIKSTALTGPVPSSGYSKVVYEQFQPVLQVFGITPSGNLFKDSLLLLHILESQKAEDAIMSYFIKYFFNLYDRDHSGYIDVQEIHTILKDMYDVIGPSAFPVTAIQSNPTNCTSSTNNSGENTAENSQVNDIIQQFMSQIDLDKNGLIDLEEFSSFIKSLPTTTYDLD